MSRKRIGYEERMALCGKKYVSDINNPIEMSVTLHDVRINGGGFSAVFTRHGMSGLYYTGFKKFMKRFPHQLSD